LDLVCHFEEKYRKGRGNPNDFFLCFRDEQRQFLEVGNGNKGMSGLGSRETRKSVNPRQWLTFA